MNQSLALAMPAQQAVWPAAPVRPAAARRRFGLLNPLATLRMWEERVRFRWQLKETVRTAPHLIEDMGLTREQVEAEIAKRFWQE